MTQSERHVVVAAKVLVDQRLKIDVGQNIAAVGQERLAAEMTFRVLNAAARFEQVRLVNKCDGKVSILARGKESLEQFRMAMRGDDESRHSYAYQMIRRKENHRPFRGSDE